MTIGFMDELLLTALLWFMGGAALTVWTNRRSSECARHQCPRSVSVAAGGNRLTVARPGADRMPPRLATRHPIVVLEPRDFVRVGSNN